MTFRPKTTPLAKKLTCVVMGGKGRPMTRKRHTEEQIIVVLQEAEVEDGVLLAKT